MAVAPGPAAPGTAVAGARSQPNEALAGQRFPALDGLRALAALGIIATHAGFVSGRSLRTDLLGATLGRLDLGVAVFFLLSGFLLYRPFATRALARGPIPHVVRFWWRRALRIFPALWLSVSLTLAVISQRQSTSSDWWHYLLLVQVYDHHEVDPNFSQLWTLSAEIAFYALLPLAGVLVSRRAFDPAAAFRRSVFLICALMVAAVAYNIIQSNLLRHAQALLWMPAYLDWFAAGMALAVLSAMPRDEPMLARTRSALREWAAAPWTCWAAAAALWLFTTTQLGTPRNLAPPTFWQWTIQHYLYLAAAVLVMLPLVLADNGPLIRVLGGRAGEFLGNISYAIYLWHLPLLLLIQRELGFNMFQGHFWELLFLTTFASIAVASVSWYLVERPILRYGSRAWRG
jgi:acetyltransferase